MHIQGGFSKAYQKGVDKFYTEQGSNYQNPHRYDIERVLRKKLSKPNAWIKYQSKILDLACGSGEVTGPLVGFGYKNIRGTDPYTYQQYRKLTNKQCDTYSFMDILQDCYGQQKFHCIIISYALHLVKQSLLHDFCNKLSQLSQYLIVIAPHKLPVMREDYGWMEVENSSLDKIHFRVFKSYNFVVEGKEGEGKQQNQQKGQKINMKQQGKN